MSEFWSEELITAYLDDRLSPSEREQVEAHLNANPGDADTVEEFRQLRSVLRGAPRHQLDDQFAERVIREINSRSESNGVSPVTAPLATESPVKPVLRVSKPHVRGTRWRTVAIVAGSLAATLLLAVFLLPRPSSHDNVAEKSHSEQPPSSSHTMDSDASLAPAENSSSDTVAQEDQAGGTEMAQPMQIPTPKQGQESEESSARHWAQPGKKPGAQESAESDMAVRGGLKEGQEIARKKERDAELSSKEKMLSDDKTGNAVTDDAMRMDVESLNDVPEDSGKAEDEAYADFSTDNLIVINAPSTKKNMQAIQSLESGLQPEAEDQPRTGRGMPTLSNKEPATGDLAAGGAGKNKKMKELNEQRPRPDRSRSKLAGGSVDSESASEKAPGSGLDFDESVNHEQLLEDSFVFEVVATPDELKQLLAKVDGRQLALKESSQYALLDHVKDIALKDIALNQEGSLGLGGGGLGGGGGGQRNAGGRGRSASSLKSNPEGPTVRRLSSLSDVAEEEAGETSEHAQKDGNARRSRRQRKGGTEGQSGQQQSDNQLAQQQRNEPGDDNRDREGVRQNSRDQGRSGMNNLQDKEKSRKRYLLVINVGKLDAAGTAPPSRNAEDKK